MEVRRHFLVWLSTDLVREVALHVLLELPLAALVKRLHTDRALEDLQMGT